jgi:hypothetical protein
MDEPVRVPKRRHSAAVTPDDAADPLLMTVTHWLAADADMAAAFAHTRRERGLYLYQGDLAPGAGPVSLLQCRHTLALFPPALDWPDLAPHVQVALVMLLCLLCEAPDAPSAGWSALGAAALTPKPFGGLLRV